LRERVRLRFIGLLLPLVLLRAELDALKAQLAEVKALLQK
jgi:hypothetical protein